LASLVADTNPCLGNNPKTAAAVESIRAENATLEFEIAANKQKHQALSKKKNSIE
jgi:hypothetical protein